MNLTQVYYNKTTKKWRALLEQGGEFAGIDISHKDALKLIADFKSKSSENNLYDIYIF